MELSLTYNETVNDYRNNKMTQFLQTLYIYIVINVKRNKFLFWTIQNDLSFPLFYVLKATYLYKAAVIKLLIMEIIKHQK